MSCQKQMSPERTATLRGTTGITAQPPTTPQEEEEARRPGGMREPRSTERLAPVTHMRASSSPQVSAC